MKTREPVMPFLLVQRLASGKTRHVLVRFVLSSLPRPDQSSYTVDASFFPLMNNHSHNLWLWSVARMEEVVESVEGLRVEVLRY